MEFLISSGLDLVECKKYAVGRRKLDDDLFRNDKPPPRLGVFDLDDENLCHEVVKTSCTVPGCMYKAETILDFENHYNSSHRYNCAQCKKVLPSPHLLDLHIQESHDSFFAVMAERKPSFCCYIEECKEKFMNSHERMEHCINIHKLPPDFRFEIKYKKSQKLKKPKVNKSLKSESMELDDTENTKKTKNNLMLFTSKSKAFPKYTGKKFTRSNDNEKTTSKDIDMDVLVDNLKESLPQ